MQAQPYTPLAPGERLVKGEAMYSARWLNDARPQDAMSALERARKAWSRVSQQLELPLHDEERGTR
jgi:hypothetical protein